MTFKYFHRQKGRGTILKCPTTSHNSQRISFNNPIPFITTLKLAKKNGNFIDRIHTEKQEKMEGSTSSSSSKILLMTILFAAILGPQTSSAADDSSTAALAAKCSPEFQKVMPCLTFVTSKANAPTKECCDSATELKNDDQVCLCFIIQQIHNGTNAAVKNMGVQESRLLQLPAACKMTNASVSECPKLLHLPANSPDAAIFTNTTIPTANGTSSPTTSTPASAVDSGSDGVSYRKPPTSLKIITTTAAIVMVIASVYSV